MERVLITGGAGFLGSHLCEKLLGDGKRVICLDNFSTGRFSNVSPLVPMGLDIVRHDVEQPCPAEVEVDQIYHLACPASPPQYQRDPVRTLMTAFLGTRNALELAKRCGARVLIASTSEVYGDPEVHPQTEEYWGHVNPVGERACYDEGKRAAEALAIAYATRDSLDVRIARIFNTYGPRMHEADGRVVSNFIVQAISGQPISLYGDGSQTRSFCYVSDLISGLERLMEVDANPGPVNLGNPEEMSVAALAALVLELSGSSSAIINRSLPSDDPRRRRPDISKARQCLDWTPRVLVRTGVSRTLADFRARLARRELEKCAS